MVSFLEKGKKEEVKCQFCGGLGGDGHLFWERAFLLILHVGNFPSLRPSWLEAVVTGPGACFGTAGCLDLVLLVSATPGRPRLAN